MRISTDNLGYNYYTYMHDFPKQYQTIHFAHRPKCFRNSPRSSLTQIRDTQSTLQKREKSIII